MVTQGAAQIRGSSALLARAASPACCRVATYTTGMQRAQHAMLQRGDRAELIRSGSGSGNALPWRGVAVAVAVAVAVRVGCLARVVTSHD